jgi:uncharacterized protein (DUF2237 family)
MTERNVLGGELQPCGSDPMTGFYRDGNCSCGDEDFGLHAVCAVMTAEFLQHQREVGNDLTTPRPELAFPGLRPGDRWCVVAARWLQAYQAGVAAGVVLAATLAAKLVWEACVVWRLIPDRPPPRGTGPVPAHGLARFLLGVSAVALALTSTGGPGAGLAVAAVLAGELIERARFFSAASWTGMPGPKR